MVLKFIDYEVAESLSMKCCFLKFSGTSNILTFICILCLYKLRGRKHSKGKYVERKTKKKCFRNSMKRTRYTLFGMWLH